MDSKAVFAAFFFISMEELVFATNNPHKLNEIRELLKDRFAVTGLRDRGIREDIPEEQETLEGNALQKARYIYEKYRFNCFADDTGLEVDALGGAPGVYSARYSRMGKPVYDTMEVTAGNIRKLLEKMNGESNRRARFRTVIALIMGGQEYLFEGEVPGHIATSPSGEEGFGYDPVFHPDGYDCSFAEMDLSLKNRISHRANAMRRLVEFLKK